MTLDAVDSFMLCSNVREPFAPDSDIRKAYSRHRSRMGSRGHVGRLRPRRNIRCFISLRRDRCTEKTLIQGTFPRETGSDYPLNKTAIRKYGVFADGPVLPFRDTGFWARNGVSLQWEASVFAKPARDTDFWTGKGVSRQEKQFNARKPVHDTGFFAEKGVSLQGKTSVSQNPLAIQTFGRKMACRGKKNSSMHENPFTTQGFGPKMVCRGMGKQLNRRKPVRDWSMGGRMRVGGQLRFHGCDFLLSLRPFFEKLRSVV